jgi:hypothetical protein
LGSSFLKKFLSVIINFIKYISDLNVSNSIKNILNKLKNLSEDFIKKEDQSKLYIGSDYNLYLDFIEP